MSTKRAVEEQARFWKKLGTLLGGGVPLVEALETLAAEAKDRGLRRAIGKATDRVRGQGALADGLAESPRVFAAETVARVRRAEAAGTLDRAAPEFAGELLAGKEEPAGAIPGLPPREALEKFGRLVREALKEGASAIHVGNEFDETTQRSVPRLHFRVGRELREMRRLSEPEYADLLARAKQMSDLDLAERRLPQDGRMMLGIDGKRIDLLVSTMPCVLGEHLCLRLFEHAQLAGGVAELDLPAGASATVRAWCRRPYGLVLVAGPAFPMHGGVYYSLLAEARGGRQVVTVEDPVESVLAGVHQVQVEPRFGFTMARAIRAAMRQDPDVLAIADLRDPETAALAADAALAGHLVLARTPGLDAADALASLAALVDGRRLAQALAGALAWDQLPRLCPSCRESYAPAPDRLAELGPRAAVLGGRAHRALGCSSCSAGRAGMIRVYEVLEGDDAVRGALRGGGSAAAIRAAAGDAHSLSREACVKASAGEADLGDVLRLCARIDAHLGPHRME